MTHYALAYLIFGLACGGAVRLVAGVWSWRCVVFWPMLVVGVSLCTLGEMLGSDERI